MTGLFPTLMSLVAVVALVAGCQPSSSAVVPEDGAAPAGAPAEIVAGEAAFAPRAAAENASTEARKSLEAGFNALHSFWYEEARNRFAEAQRLEPDTVMAYWGEALSHHYPFGFSGGDIEALRATLARLAPSPSERAAKARTERERQWLVALEALAGEGSDEERRKEFSVAMGDLARRRPDDAEAWAFYALSLFGTAQNARKHEALREEIVGVAEHVLERSPRHPGALHYKIHALDSPQTAERALEAVRVFAGLDLGSSHAIHMASHIYFHLGMWEEANAINQRAFEVSEAWVEQEGLGLEKRDHHAADFLHYSLLEQGRYQEAHRWVTRMDELEPEVSHWFPRFWRAQWSARERVEREEWGSGPLPQSGFFSRDELLVAGLDAAKSGDQARARKLLEMMRTGERQAAGLRSVDFPEQRWRIVVASVEAAIAAAEGRFDQARRAIARAVATHGELPPPNETPNPMKPPHELQGEILLAAGDAGAAVLAFEESLRQRPSRARSMLGLARAAVEAGERDKATEAYRRLLEQWASADSGVVDRVKAEERTFLSSL